MKPGMAKVTVSHGFQNRTFTIPLTEYLTLIRKLEAIEQRNKYRNPIGPDYSEVRINGERFV